MEGKTVITISSCYLPGWWPYTHSVTFEEYLGGTSSFKKTIKKSDHTTFPFRYLVNTTRCIYIGGPGGIVAFVKDEKMTITLRDMDFDLALLKENMQSLQSMLDTHYIGQQQEDEEQS